MGQEIQQEVQGINREVRGLKQDVAAIKGGETGIKENVNEMSEDIKREIANVTGSLRVVIKNVDGLSARITSLDQTCAAEASCKENYRVQTIGCQTPSLYMEGLGCITPLLTRITWEEAKTQCESRGMRLLQDFTREQMIRIVNHFRVYMSDPYYPWVGFKDRKWIGSGQNVADDLIKSKLQDGKCGDIYCPHPTNPYLGDYSCDYEAYALCQLTVVPSVPIK